VKDKKQKSTIVKDAMALFVITLVSSLALSFVYEITKDPIARAQEQKKLEAYKVVYTKAASIKVDEKLTKVAEKTDLKKLDASYESVSIDEVNRALDSNGKLLGYVVKISTKGYKDTIALALGYSLDGTVQGMEIMQINDTAGLGMNAEKPEFKNQFANKKTKEFEVTKTGATKDNQINAISGATITSKAVVKGVNAGMEFVKKNVQAFGGGTNE
jgi:electron transport complex protein RnfG